MGEMSHAGSRTRRGVMENPSEVMQILAQIESEYLAASLGLSGLAEAARHAAINARMENIGRLHRSLQAIVGEDATKLIAERLETIPETNELA
jgi:hypothetical protein